MHLPSQTNSLQFATGNSSASIKSCGKASTITVIGNIIIEPAHMYNGRATDWEKNASVTFSVLVNNNEVSTFTINNQTAKQGAAGHHWGYYVYPSKMITLPYNISKNDTIRVVVKSKTTDASANHIELYLH